MSLRIGCQHSLDDREPAEHVLLTEANAGLPRKPEAQKPADCTPEQHTMKKASSRKKDTSLFIRQPEKAFTRARR
jgi:hypothetical protein